MARKIAPYIALAAAAATAAGIVVWLLTESASAAALGAALAVITGGAIRWPALPLYAVVLASPLYFIWNSMLTSGNLGFTTKVSVIDVLTATAVLTLTPRLLRPLLRRNQPTRDRRSAALLLDIACGVWLAIAAAAFLHGIEGQYEAVFRSSRGALLWGLYFPAVAYFSSQARRQEAFGVLCVSALLLAVVGLAAASGFLTAAFPTLPVGTLGGGLIRPNFFAEPALAIPNIVLTSLLSVTMRPLAARLGLAIVGLGNLALLLISVTRGFWVGMVVAIIACLLLLAWKRILNSRTLVGGLAIAIFGALIVEASTRWLRGISVLEVLIERAVTSVTGDVHGVDFRLAEFDAYFQSFLRSPIFGNGFGSPVHFDPLDENIGFAHNQYVFLLQTTGVLGTTALAIFLVLAIVVSLQQLRLHRRELAPTVLPPLVLSATLAGYAATSLTSPELTNIATVPALALLTALVRSSTFGRTQ